MIKIDFCEKIDYINNVHLKNELNKLKIVQSWCKLLDALPIDDVNFKKKQKITQYICSELNLTKTIELDGNVIELNHITPRLMWEYGYNVVIIKPSAYLIGIQSSCEDFVVSNRKNIINYYNCNLGETNLYGLNPMAFFHPHGMKYKFQMSGPSKIILVNDNSKDLNTRKHYIRDNMAQQIQKHFVTWYNGSKVLWDTKLNTNLVHTTDDAPEASVHALAGYPEYQLFTRFNYPNPVLRKEKKK